MVKNSIDISSFRDATKFSVVESSTDKNSLISGKSLKQKVLTGWIKNVLSFKAFPLIKAIRASRQGTDGTTLSKREWTEARMERNLETIQTFRECLEKQYGECGLLAANGLRELEQSRTMLTGVKVQEVLDRAQMLVRETGNEYLDTINDNSIGEPRRSFHRLARAVAARLGLAPSSGDKVLGDYSGSLIRDLKAIVKESADSGILGEAPTKEDIFEFCRLQMQSLIEAKLTSDDGIKREGVFDRWLTGDHLGVSERLKDMTDTIVRELGADVQLDAEDMASIARHLRKELDQHSEFEAPDTTVARMNEIVENTLRDIITTRVGSKQAFEQLGQDEFDTRFYDQKLGKLSENYRVLGGEKGRQEVFDRARTIMREWVATGDVSNPSQFNIKIIDALSMAVEAHNVDYLKSLDPQLDEQIGAMGLKLNVANQRLQKLVDKAGGPDGLQPDKLKQVLAEYSKQKNLDQMENLLGENYMARIWPCFRKAVDRGGVPAPLDHFSTAMFDKIRDVLKPMVEQDPRMNGKALSEHEMDTMVTEHMATALERLSDAPNIKALQEMIPPGTPDRALVLKMAAGILGDRLFANEPMSSDELQKVVGRAQKTTTEIMQTMRQDARGLAEDLVAFAGNGSKKQDILQKMKRLDECYAKLPEELKTGGLSRLNMHNMLLDEAMESVPGETLETLRKSGLSLQSINDEYMAQAETEDGPAKKIAVGMFFTNDNRAPQKTISRDRFTYSLTSGALGGLVRGMGRHYIDTHLGSHSGQLRGGAKLLGKGIFNSVYKGSYGDEGYVGVFKPVSWTRNIRSSSAQGIGIDGVNRNLYVRNVVARDIEETLLHTHMLPDCEFVKQGGRRGILMEFMPGANTREISRTNLTLRRGLTRLAFMDALMGQVDRHVENFSIRTDETGTVTGVCGIDNDLCLGATLGEQKNDLFVLASDQNHALHQLPPLIEKSDYDAYMAITEEQIDKVVGDRLSRDEVDALKTRLGIIKQHLTRLNETGMVLDAKLDGFETRFQTTYDQKANGLNSYLARHVTHFAN